MPELSILFFVTRGSLKRICRICGSTTSPEESIYSRDDDVFFPPFSENGSQNLISMHFQYSMPYRSIVTHLLLTSSLWSGCVCTSRRVRSLMMTHCSRACSSVLMI